MNDTLLTLSIPDVSLLGRERLGRRAISHCNADRLGPGKRAPLATTFIPHAYANSQSLPISSSADITMVETVRLVPHPVESTLTLPSQSTFQQYLEDDEVRLTFFSNFPCALFDHRQRLRSYRTISNPHRQVKISILIDNALTDVLDLCPKSPSICVPASPIANASGPAAWEPVQAGWIQPPQGHPVICLGKSFGGGL